MKIVINKCYGGFGLSPAALLDLYEGGWSEIGTPVAEWFGTGAKASSDLLGLQRQLSDWRAFLSERPERVPLFLTVFSKDESQVLCFDRDRQWRTDPRLIEIVERMGPEASSPLAKLVVVEIPDGVEWELDEYDGIETVREQHRSWS